MRNPFDALRAHASGLATVARVLAVIGLVGMVVAVTGALLTGAVPRRFTALTPQVVSPTPVAPSAHSPSPSAHSPSPSPSPTLDKVHVVALGDSVTAGTNCDCTPFPTLYAQDLADKYDIKSYVRNDGVPGSTSSDLLNDLKTDDGEQEAVGGADIVVVTIGANDFGDDYDDVANGTCGGANGVSCARDELNQLPDNLNAIVHQIRDLRDGAPTAILLTGYWNVFEDGDVAKDTMTAKGRTESDSLTQATNEVVRQVARHEQATYVDLYAPFKGDDGADDPTKLLADDGDHPNAAGHKVIAEALMDAGTAPLVLG